ncbi:hypothetical protein B0A48_04770 [Cryoendolithus antarcticus]|uniref:RING-type domain-containing protein n=1 Tax=Cryoendolithus antarcticus TaxID=1507870 RepID=A0A1V8TDT6_9PEZI|nr:hypothetical protein B0A48_04770 [Cryoendolithus antarcticus]
MSSSTRVKPTLKRKASEASYSTNSQPRKRSLASRKECIVCTEDRYQDQFPAPLQKKGHSHSMDVCLDKATAALLAKDEEFFSCTSADCHFGGLISKNDGNIFRCEACETRSCVECQTSFHEGKTCKDYQASTRQGEEDKKSVAKVKKMSKPCPGCKTNFQKYTGCNHITCPICKAQWCWLCFAPYTGKQGINRIGNGAHTARCMYHPARLPDYEGGYETEPGTEAELSDAD